MLARLDDMNTTILAIDSRLRRIEDMTEKTLNAATRQGSIVPQNVATDKAVQSEMKVALSSIQKNMKGQAKNVDLLAKKIMMDEEEIRSFQIDSLLKMDETCDRISSDDIYKRQLVNFDYFLYAADIDIN